MTDRIPGTAARADDRPPIPAELVDPALDDGADRVRAFIADIEAHGQTRDPRGDIDTDSLRARFPHLLEVEVREFPVHTATETLPARIYRARSAQEGAPAFVWIHGGGWIAGDIDFPEAHWVSMELAARGIVVVSLDYRKAIGGLGGNDLADDVYRGWAAAAAELDKLSVPPTSIHLGGASAGAGLAAGLSRRLHRERRAPNSLTLVYPLMHRELPEMSSALLDDLRGVPPEHLITPAGVRVYTSNIAGAHGDGADDILLGDAPIYIRHARTLILNVQRDVLRASGERYAQQLVDAGVPVEQQTQPAAYHGVINNPGEPEAVAMLDRMSAWIRDTPRAS